MIDQPTREKEPNMTTLPEKPVDWIASGPIIVEQVSHPMCAVIHRSQSDYEPFVVHTAYHNGNEWAYVNGTYCQTLDSALKYFKKHNLMKNMEV
jgi:hypothetical protein